MERTSIPAFLFTLVLTIFSTNVAAQEVDSEPSLPTGEQPVFEYVGSIEDPCDSPYGPNFVTFINKGEAPGQATFVYGVNLCTKKIFQYRTATRSTILEGFDANPPSVNWADSETPFHRGLYEDKPNVAVGVLPMALSTTADTTSKEIQNKKVAAGVSVGLRVGKFKLSGIKNMVPPTDKTWFARLTWTPFKDWSPKVGPQKFKDNAWQSDEVRKFSIVRELCNETGVGIRGFDSFRLDEETGEVIAMMVSFCTEPYRVYRVRLRPEHPYFNELNNTYPGFADWGRSAKEKAWFADLGFSVGLGNLNTSIRDKELNTTSLYVGIELPLWIDDWWLDMGHIFLLEDHTLRLEGESRDVFVSGWAIGVHYFID